MIGDLREAIESAVDSKIAQVASVSGGNINETYRVALNDGRTVFVKTHSHAPKRFFACEADGLSWLAEAHAIRTPQVIAVSEDGVGQPFLILEWLESAPKAADFDEVLGRSLAQLHRSGAPAFGYVRDNYVGDFPQANTTHEMWASFYAAERITPLVRLAVDKGLIGSSLAKKCTSLVERMTFYVGDEEAPCRLHGDLWGGNVHVGPQGQPCLIDPAVYGGHREIDLAMMRLFGGFSQRVFDAYEEAFPLLPGALQRVPLYQIYPLLVHVHLFGSGYVRAVESTLARIMS